MRRNRRKDFRVEWNSKALIFNDRGREARPCIVSNLSNAGAKILLPSAESLTTECKLRISECSPLRNCVGVWRTPEAVGVQFLDVQATAEPAGRQDAKLLRRLDAERRRAF